MVWYISVRKIDFFPLAFLNHVVNYKVVNSTDGT